jgi:AcrR family transcriptional regulator
VGPSAIYRHYAGKAEVLYDVVDVALEHTLAILPTAAEADLSGFARILAANVLENRLVGVLWQREARELGEAERARLQKKLREINRRFTDQLSTRRPELTPAQAELLAMCALGALTSVSFHRLTPPYPQFESLLTELALRVLVLDPPVDPDPDPAARRKRVTSRPERLLGAAIPLFARKGYAAVSIDDIGAAVGIAGPSVYNHFPSKQDILTEAMKRGHAQLSADLRAARAQGTGPDDVLRRVTSSYVDLALGQPDLIATLISESVHLDRYSAGHDARTAQRAYIADWVTLVRARNPADSPTVARIKVQAAQMVANNIARAPQLRRVPGLRGTVREVCWVLQQ